VDWAVEYLLGLVKEEEKKENIEPSRVMLGGFSQVFMCIYMCHCSGSIGSVSSGASRIRILPSTSKN
jgi:hypothetical protein